MSENILNHPPFPPLVATEYFWEGEIVVPFWVGYAAWQPLLIESWKFNQKEMEEKGITEEAWREKCAGARDGRFNVSVAPPQDQTPGPATPPTAPQAAAFQQFLGNQESTSRAVLKAIANYVKEEQPEWWLDIFDDDKALKKHLAGLKGLDRYRRLLSPNAIHVQNREKDGAAYLGFEFVCSWDEEHGCGVLTHLGQIITVLDADVSFSPLID